MSIRVSNSELEVLNVLWEAGTPLHRGGILENSKDKTWKDSYIHILLNKMLENGLIREAGFTRSGKVWARQYAPAVTPEEYYADALKALPLVCLARMLRDGVEKVGLSVEDVVGIENAIHQIHTLLVNRYGNSEADNEKTEL